MLWFSNTKFICFSFEFEAPSVPVTGQYPPDKALLASWWEEPSWWVRTDS